MTSTADSAIKRKEFRAQACEDFTASLDYVQLHKAHSRPKWCKFIWAIIAVSCAGFAVFTVYNLLSSYLQFKSYDQQTDRWVDEVALPAITICNLNVVNLTEWKERVADDTLVESLNWFLKELAITHKSDLSYLTDDERDRAKTLDTLELDVDGTTKRIDILEMFHSKFDMFILGDGENHPMMEFANKWQSEDVWSTHITELGECLTVNDDERFKQRLGGVIGGFTIDLNARVDEYLPSTSSAGFMLFLRNPQEVVQMNKGGILLSPGKEVFVNLKRQNIKRLKPRYGNCSDEKSLYTDARLTVRECTEETYLYLAIQLCECIPWFFSHTLRLYGLEDNKEFLQNLRELYEFDDFASDACDFVREKECAFIVNNELKNESKSCEEPCSFTQWTYNINTGKFPPTKRYFEHFIQDYAVVEGENGKDILDYNYAVENLVRLHVYYDEIKVTEIEQTKDKEVYNFIAELGGVTDLMIGLSFFTVFQMSEIVIAVLIYKCCKKNRSPRT